MSQVPGGADVGAKMAEAVQTDLEVSVELGKYRFIQDRQSSKIAVKRHDQDWLEFTPSDTTGFKAIAALLYEIRELRERTEKMPRLITAEKLQERIINCLNQHLIPEMAGQIVYADLEPQDGPGFGICTPSKFGIMPDGTITLEADFHGDVVALTLDELMDSKPEKT